MNVVKSFIKRQFSKVNNFNYKTDIESYKQNRMTIFDQYALESILKKFGSKDLICLEIGSWFGAGSTQIIGKYSKELTCIDHWKGADNIEHKSITKQIDVFEYFQENVKHFGDKVIPIKDSSANACANLENEKFDFIFVDGDHKYTPTKIDINASKRLLKKGGILAGHDCEGLMTSQNRELIIENCETDHIYPFYKNFSSNHPGVIRAVSELIEKPNLFANQLLKIGDEEGYSTIWWTKY